MASQMRYVSGVTGDVIELDGPITWIGIAGGLRRGAWSYNLEGRTITSPRRAAREEEVEAYTTIEAADGIAPIADADVAMRRPGTFEGNGWTQRGYITGVEPTDVRRPRCKLKLNVVLLDGAWRKKETMSMRQASGDASGTKKYPFVYPYTYASEFGVRYIEVNDAAPIPFGFTFFGPAANPKVRIGSNCYEFDITVPEGGYLSVESLPEATVTLVDKDGKRTNEFSCAKRGDGEGSGSYAFERIPPGTEEVWWSDMFGFDLTLVHERSDFPLCS